MCFEAFSKFGRIGERWGAGELHQHEALWECPDQDEEVGAKHIADTKRFQPASCEPIPPLAGEPGELVELDDDLTEDPTIASLSGVDSSSLNVDDSLPINDNSNDMDTLLAM